MSKQNRYSYWGIKQPDFLKLNKYSDEKIDEARKWCRENCQDKFISATIHPWAFLNEQDAMNFQKRYGGTLVFKPADNHFQDLNTPTEFDFEFLKVVWQYMTPEERLEFDHKIKDTFSEWDITAFKELTRTILFVKDSSI